MRPTVVCALLVAVLAGTAQAFGNNCPRSDNHVMRGTPVWPTPMKENLKVGFFGDGGIKDSSEAVVRDLVARGADFIIHAGDFDYEYNAALWIEFIDRVVGPDFPYFAAIGNHDLLRWADYSEYLLQRMERLNATQYCTGEVGVMAACNWEGLFFVLSGVGVRGTGHPEYLDEQLGLSNDIWKVCSWHKNQRGYQTGGKYNAVGWDVYETCREHGAIINTAHEHSYARTHLMSHMEDFVIANTSNTLQLEPGKSFVWCSGLGGQSVRGWERGLEQNEWWAATAASDNGATDGGLMCTFNYNGDARKAYCEMIDLNGVVWDTFYIVSTIGGENQTMPEKRSKCMSRTMDMQISHRHHDKVITVESNTDEIALMLVADTDHEVKLHFGAPGLNPASITEARLEVYGLVAQHDVALTITVTGVDEEIVWTEDDEDWETGTVWVSPDISALIRKGLEVRKDIEITVTADDGSRTFAAYETDPCLAPSLLVTYKEC